jgi:hypothetical protein
MGRFFKFLFRFVVVLMLLPSAVGAAIGYAKGWPANWRVAAWTSSGILASADAQKPATVIILASRTGQWKSIFAEHMSIVFKPENANHWTRYDVVGWGKPIRQDAYVADALWYGNTPRVIYRLEGPAAASLIPDIKKSIQAYPNNAEGSYVIWPGPNSNTFVSWVVRHTKGFDAELSSVAVGKDYLGPGFHMARAPSDTGFTVSWGGYLGATLALEEGAELHLIGSTIGIDPNDLAIKLPALGKLSVFDLSR